VVPKGNTVAHPEQWPDDEAPSTTAASLSRSLWQILWRRKALIVIGAAAGLVLGSLFYSQQQPVYQTGAKVLVIKKNQERVLPTGTTLGVSYVEDYLATHVQLLQSPLIIERAVKKFELHTLKSFENRDPTGAIAAGLGVSRDNPKDSSSGPSNIVNLSFKGPVSDDCPRVLNALIETYRDFLDQAYLSANDQTLSLITQAREFLKKDLDEARAKHRKFRADSQILWQNKDGVSVPQERFHEIETQRTALLKSRAELKGKIEAVERDLKEGRFREAQAIANLQLADGKTAVAEQKSLEETLWPLRQQEIKLRTEYGYSDDHPQVRSVLRQMEKFKELYEKAQGPRGGKGDKADQPLNPVERYLATLRHELGRVTALHKSLEEVLNELNTEARALSSLVAEESDLRANIVQLEELHKATVKRLTEMSLTKDAGGFNAQVLSRPGPGGQVAPNLMMTLLAGFFLGGFAGVGLAYLAEFSDRGFRSSEEVRLRLGLPLVGHIPFLKPDAEAVRKAGAGEPTPDPLLVTHHNSMSVEAESYRAVRTALFFSTQDEGRKVIQVTSPTKGDGKSLLIANLAVSIAQSGKKVLLIDADCRRPRQHKVFGLSAPVGLANVIAGETEFAAALQASCTRGLDVLPAGPIRPNPAELLTSPRFQALLDTVREQYDYVLVDTPPLLAVTDPCVVAAHADGLFLVIRLTREARPKAERAREILSSLGVKVFGVVVNGITRQGGPGLYSSERYDYTESYEETEDDGDGYYQADPEPGAGETPAALPPKEPTASVQPPSGKAPLGGPKRAKGGLFGWLLSWWL
jgi:capsular exopolysaccharide synthesis family protein